MMSLTFGLFTQVSGSGPLGPLVYVCVCALSIFMAAFRHKIEVTRS